LLNGARRGERIVTTTETSHPASRDTFSAHAGEGLDVRLFVENRATRRGERPQAQLEAGFVTLQEVRVP
jgi:hypothetical protein